MGMQVGGNKGGAMADMNVVPLIDILLVLLIIFMVINPQNEMGLNALVPQPSPPSQQQELQQQTIVVQILDTGKIKINDEDSSWNQLESRLEEVFKERATKTAFIKGDDNVLFADVAKAIGMMRDAGIENVGFLTPHMEQGQ
jgi:biopolymer transport protein TolR